MRTLALVVVTGWGLVAGLLGTVAHAEPAVALLPLDAEPRLEIYGQPVASEVARALVAGGVDVVVVGPRMAVPERAGLVVDGRIRAGAGEQVVLSLRIRERESGAVLDTLTADAAALTSIDEAAATLSARALPAVRAHLVAKPTAPRRGEAALPHVESPPSAPPPALVIAVTGGPATEPLRAALGPATEAWARARKRVPRTVPWAELAPLITPGTLARASAHLGLALEVLSYTVEPGPVPLARARVRARLSEPSGAVFDRVVVTDTVVGDRGQAPAALAARVADAVLAIVSPNAARAATELATP